MQEKKLNLLGLIAIMLVTLVVGIVIGYFVIDYIKNGEEVTEVGKVQEVKQEKLEETKIENTQSTLKTEIPEYDGSKSITIKGKTYTISYLSEKYTSFSNSEVKQTEVKLYLNDEKVKTLNLGNLLDVNHEYGSKDYGVELYNFCEDYILIAIKTKYNNGESEPVNHLKCCVINVDGEHIDTLEWNDATQIHDVKTQKQLTYEINNDNIILYELSSNGANKMKYSAIRDIMKKELLKVYNENEVSLAGK